MEKSQRKSVAWCVNQLTDGLDGNEPLDRQARDVRTELVNLLDQD